MKRRDVLRKVGGIGIAAMAGLPGCNTDLRQVLVGVDTAADEARENVPPPTPKCVLAPSQTSGPFYFNANQVRRDITEGRPGIPLRLVLDLVDVDTCLPVTDALVDIWHTDFK